MAIKSEVSHTRGVEENYPILKVCRDGGSVVLFISPMSGIVVSAGKESGQLIGETNTNWNPNFFETFTGEITLRNE